MPAGTYGRCVAKDYGRLIQGPGICPGQPDTAKPIAYYGRRHIDCHFSASIFGPKRPFYML